MPIQSFAIAAHSHLTLTQKKAEDSTKKATDDAQEVPNNDDESKDENENFAIKVFTNLSREVAIYHEESIAFVLYNTQHLIQFHPEFSTPPPKQFFA